LLTTDHHFLWFQCLGEEGFAPPRHVERVADLNSFPNVMLGRADNRVRLADMNGDGLDDIVFVHDGRIEYWPNQGYGRFGPCLPPEAPPRLGPDVDPRRLFLADLDGTGCADLVYVEADCVRFWFNRSGNGWSAEQVIEGTPFTSSDTAVTFADV